MGSFYSELKRRNVVRVSIAYIVVSWLLVQAAGVLEPALLLPDWVDRVVTVFLLIGFPVVILFAWAFEMTPDGVKLTKDVDHSSSITRTTGKKLEYFTIGALSLVVVFFLIKEFVPFGDQAGIETAQESAATTESIAEEAFIPPSIAVLPFEDYSEKADQGHFSRGIAEEILNLLAKTRGLRVAARTSSFAFAGSEIDIRDIGNKLNVDTVLEGSIRKAGNKIRITAQLIKIEDGYHLWSETYDRDYSDIFKIQDEISASIMSSLRVHLLGEEEKIMVAERAKNMDAYSAYLIGRERMALHTDEDIEVARGKFEEAIAIDPEYAPAYTALARSVLQLEGSNGVEESAEVKAENDMIIEMALTKSVELSPGQPETIAVRGLHHYKRYRYEEARADFDRALELNPNFAIAYLWRSETFYEQEQFLDMLADKEKAYSLDPMSLEISDQLAYDYGAFWRPRDADRIIARMFELHPNHQRAYTALARNLSAHGRYAESALALEEALEYFPDSKMFKTWHAWDLTVMGLFDEAEAADVDAVSFWVNLHYGRLERARELAEKVQADAELPYWARFGPKRALSWELRKEQGMQPFKSAVAENYAYFEENDIPWVDSCRLYLLFDMKKAGLQEGENEMMEKCRKTTEERLQAKFLCPCSWFNLVSFATIDGRTDDAIARAQQWLDNGDSYSMLHLDPIMQEWSDRPEYQEILERNNEQVERQKALYWAGVAAREKSDAAQTAGSGN
jgi:TolB-like protein/Tfp pilus assembly protein PilF